MISTNKYGVTVAKKAYRVRNWAEYNKSLVQRGSLTLWIYEEIINGSKRDAEGLSHGNQKYLIK